MADLERAFAAERAAINAERAKLGKPPLDAAAEAELRAEINQVVSSVAAQQADSERGARSAFGSAARDALGTIVTGAADPIVKIATNLNSGQTPKLLKPVADWRPETPGRDVSGAQNLFANVTEGAMLEGAGRVLNTLPKIGKGLKMMRERGMPTRMVANAAESGGLSAGLDAAEGGSAEEVGSTAKMGGVLGAILPEIARIPKWLGGKLARSPYSYKEGVDDAAMGIIDDIGMKGPLGKSPKQVSEAMRGRVDDAALGYRSAVAEHGSPMPASDIDELAQGVMDDMFALPGAKKPPSSGGPILDTGRDAKAQGKFSGMLREIDRTILQKFPRNSGTSQYLSPNDPEFGRGKIPRMAMKLAPESVADLATQVGAHNRRNVATSLKDSLQTPTFQNEMERNLGFKAVENFRKSLTERLGDTAATPEGQQIIREALKNYSTNLTAANIAEEAAAPQLMKAGSPFGPVGMRAMAAALAAGSAINYDNKPRALALASLAAILGAPRQSGVVISRMGRALEKPSLAGSIPLLLRRQRTSQEDQ